MTIFRDLLFGVLPLVGLAYCLWKTQADWRQFGYGWTVVWGVVASLSAFFSVAFLLMTMVLRDLP